MCVLSRSPSVSPPAMFFLPRYCETETLKLLWIMYPRVRRKLRPSVPPPNESPSVRMPSVESFSMRRVSAENMKSPAAFILPTFTPTIDARLSVDAALLAATS